MNIKTWWNNLLPYQRGQIKVIAATFPILIVAFWLHQVIGLYLGIFAMLIVNGIK